MDLSLSIHLQTDLSRVLITETKRKALQQGGSRIIKDKQERAQREPMVQVQHEMKYVISNLAPAEINNANPFCQGNPVRTS